MNGAIGKQSLCRAMLAANSTLHHPLKAALTLRHNAPYFADEAPIFTSVEQCLHVCFLMGTLPVSQKSQTQAVIERMIEQSGTVPLREKSTVNFSGLSPLEVRGHCAMIRAVVDDHLPAPEIAVIHARYAYQMQKAAGVRAIRDYCLPQLTIQADIATLAMAWGVFGSAAQRRELSTREIALQCHLSKSTVHRDMQRIKKIVQAIERGAVIRLEKLGILL